MRPNQINILVFQAGTAYVRRNQRQLTSKVLNRMIKRRKSVFIATKFLRLLWQENPFDAVMTVTAFDMGQLA